MKWIGYVHARKAPESRVKTKSDFSEAGPFNEMVVMGVLAVRLQGLNKELEWNGEKMEFTNISDAETVKICYLQITSQLLTVIRNLTGNGLSL